LTHWHLSVSAIVTGFSCHG